MKYFIGGRKVVTFDGGTWAWFDAPDIFVTGAAFDGGGDLWTAAASGEVYRHDGSEWTLFDTSNSPVSGMNAKLAAAGDGSIWVGTFEGCYRYSDSEWADYTGAIADVNYGYGRIVDLAVDGSGNPWFMLSVKHLASFDGDVWQRHDLEMTGNYGFDNILFDDQGNLWNAGIKSIQRIPLDEFPSFGISTAVEDESAPALFSLEAAYPNPFNPATTIAFALEQAGFVELSVHNIAGQKVRSLVSAHLSAGRHAVVWDGLDDYGSRAASGVYITRLTMGGAALSNRVTLVR